MSASYYFFFFNDTATTEIYTLSLHDALPISPSCRVSSASTRSGRVGSRVTSTGTASGSRSEEHTSELQSPCNLVCRLLLEKKKKISHNNNIEIHRDTTRQLTSHVPLLTSRLQ